eukprot:Lankesteria_metandrocarpae@DN3430_c0_g1_i1.p1
MCNVQKCMRVGDLFDDYKNDTKQSKRQVLISSLVFASQSFSLQQNKAHVNLTSIGMYEQRQPQSLFCTLHCTDCFVHCTAQTVLYTALHRLFCTLHCTDCFVHCTA